MSNLIKDVLGNELVIGDVIVYNPPYYKGLKKGIVTGFSAKYPKIDGHCVKTGVAKVVKPSTSTVKCSGNCNIGLPCQTCGSNGQYIGDINEEHY